MGNPAALMSIKNTKRVKKKPRLPFDQADLELIFSQPMFLDPTRWEGRQWLPVIALYLGCRLEEIGQLLMTDFKSINGIRYFAITTLVDDDDEEIEKSIKTESSQRNVPLHPVLERLGFSAYVQRIRQAGHKRLFPDINSKRRKVTSAYSSWFSRFKRDAGITSTRKVFHSFRHTFKDACRAAGIPVDIHDALTGHARSSVGDGYGLGYPPEPWRFQMRWKSLFPRDRFFRETDRPLFFVVPITVMGIAPVRPRRYAMFRDMLGVRANGWIIADIEGEIASYTSDGKEAVIHFRGTVPVVARNLKEALRAVEEIEFEAFGGIAEGPLRDVTSQVGHVVQWCEPNSCTPRRCLLSAPYDGRGSTTR